MICYKCGKTLKEARSNFIFPITVGVVDIENISYRQCESCGEIIFSSEEAKRFEELYHARIESKA